MKRIITILVLILLCSINGDTTTIKDVEPPSTPKGLRGTPYLIPGGNTGFIELSWDKNPEKDVAGYEIFAFDGYTYQLVGKVEGKTRWSSKGKGIWPTSKEIALGIYKLHLDKKGQDLKIDPRPVYKGNNPKEKNPSLYYYFAIRAYDRLGNVSLLSEPWKGRLFDTILPDIGIKKPVSNGKIPGIDSKSNYMIYHGEWSKDMIKEVEDKFDLVILHPGNCGLTPAEIEDIRNGKDNVLGTEDDIYVFGYLSIGTDYDPEHKRCSENWFLGFLPCGKEYFVDAGSKKWQSLLKTALLYKDGICGFDFMARTLKLDGFFLDQVGMVFIYPQVAKGMSDFIKRIRGWYPDKYIIVNNGFYYYRDEEVLAGDGKTMINFSKYTIRPYINGEMKEGYYIKYGDWLGGRDEKGEMREFFKWNNVWCDWLDRASKKEDGFTVFCLDYIREDELKKDELDRLIREQRHEVVNIRGWVNYIMDESKKISYFAYTHP